MKDSIFKDFLISKFLNFRERLFKLSYGKKRKLPTNIKKILLCRFDRLGDLVLSTSILPALKKLYPESQIDFVITPGLNDILFGNIYINRVFSPKTLSRKDLKELSKKLQKESYDLTIDLSLSRDCQSSIFLNRCNSKFNIGFSNYQKSSLFDLTVDDGNFNEHFVINIYKLIKKLGYDGEIYDPNIFLLNSELPQTDKLIKKLELNKEYMIIHPGAFYNTQKYPLEKMIKIADYCYEKFNLDIIFVGGNNDSSLLDEASSLIKNKKIKIYKTGSLREFLYLVSRSTLFFGNNSGPLHTSAALNIPTISTLGPTMGDYFHPWGEHNEYINLNLDCSPCFKSICDHHSCLVNISINSIIEKIKIIIEKKEVNFTNV